MSTLGYDYFTRIHIANEINIGHIEEGVSLFFIICAVWHRRAHDEDEIICGNSIV